MAYSFPFAAAIVDLDQGFVFKFQFKPDNISDTKGANFSDYPLLARSQPIKGFEGNASRTLSFTVKLFASPTADGPDVAVLPPVIKQQVDFLRSLPYPRYGGSVRPPSKCLIVFGAQVQMTGVCTNVDVSYPQQMPWDLGPGLAHGVEVTLNFEEIPLTFGGAPIGAQLVRAGLF